MGITLINNNQMHNAYQTTTTKYITLRIGITPRMGITLINNNTMYNNNDNMSIIILQIRQQNKYWHEDPLKVVW